MTETSPGKIRVGCPMWANRAWVGRYFPSQTPTGSELAAYATWCNTVEGNTTFYATPNEATVQRWAEDAPADFRFCFKLPRHITHERRLRDVADPLDQFMNALVPVMDRLGPVQIQLPPSFAPDDLPALADLLTHVSTEVSWAVEVRHPEFFAGGEAERPLNDLLASHAVDRVILDSRALFTRSPETREEIEAWENKPRVPVRPVATGHQPIVRLIGQRSLDRNLDEWSQWYPQLVAWFKAGLDVHVFTHTPDNLEAPDLARRFFDRLLALEPQLPLLPEPAEAEHQLGLFSA